MFLDSYFDHGQRPRNMGRMLDAHGIGNTGSIVAGRALRWADHEGENTAAAKSFLPARAVAVHLEIVVGNHRRGPGHRYQEIAEAVGGLDLAEPPQLWGVAALHDALAHIAERDGLVAWWINPAPRSPALPLSPRR